MADSTPTLASALRISISRAAVRFHDSLIVSIVQIEGLVFPQRLGGRGADSMEFKMEFKVVEEV